MRTHRPRLVVLDVGLPDIDGLEVCRRLRQTSNIPVIFLTARDGEVDRVLGLELGGDDYLTKPFSPAELVARVKAVLRRVDGGAAARGGAGRPGHRRRRAGARCASTTTPVEFTTKEFDLLRFLAERPGLALSRQQILDGVWGYDWFGDARTVDVHIAQVRKKLGDARRHHDRARRRLPPRGVEAGERVMTHGDTSETTAAHPPGRRDDGDRARCAASSPPRSPPGSRAAPRSTNARHDVQRPRRGRRRPSSTR